MQASPQWGEDTFENNLARVDGAWGSMLWEFLFGGSDHRYLFVTCGSLLLGIPTQIPGMRPAHGDPEEGENQPRCR